MPEEEITEKINSVKWALSELGLVQDSVMALLEEQDQQDEDASDTYRRRTKCCKSRTLGIHRDSNHHVQTHYEFAQFLSMTIKIPMDS